MATQILAEPGGQVVVVHCDLATKHFRFVDGTIHVVYDWDSLRVEAWALVWWPAHIEAVATFPIPSSAERSRCYSCTGKRRLIHAQSKPIKYA